ncbi:unnamed protein product [Calicophoron daubneyi]|uniref:Protein kinase domain-containing protein n=1 Tax=Calicophoron daubneyi TaxID=300641 RepID=A0AAV2TQJ9_CALDB
MNNAIRKLYEVLSRNAEHNNKNYQCEDLLIEEVLQSVWLTDGADKRTTSDNPVFNLLDKCTILVMNSRFSSTKMLLGLPHRSAVAGLFLIHCTTSGRGKISPQCVKKNFSGFILALSRLDAMYSRSLSLLSAEECVDCDLQASEHSLITMRLLALLTKTFSEFTRYHELFSQGPCLDVISRLLCTTDVSTLRLALVTLTNLARNPDMAEKMCSLPFTDISLKIISHHGDANIRKLAASFLDQMLGQPQFQPIFLSHPDAISTLLSLVASTVTDESTKPVAEMKEQKKNRLTLYKMARDACMEQYEHLAPVRVCAASCLAHLIARQGVAAQIRAQGGIPILLSCLRNALSDAISPTNMDEKSVAIQGSSPPQLPSPQWIELDLTNKETEYSICLCAAVCTILCEMAVDDFTAQLIVRDNGIYLLGQQLVLSRASSTTESRAKSARVNSLHSSARQSDERKAHSPRAHSAVIRLSCSDASEKCGGETDPLQNLQIQVFRTLRRLFVFERNRRLIKALLPVSLLAELVELKRTAMESLEFADLVTRLNKLDDENRIRLIEGLAACNLAKPPTHWIREYGILELLGSGAFGQVYKARKSNSAQIMYAIKEVNTLQAMFGRNTEERQQSIGRILNEVNIIRQQLRHPNIVRYYKTFIHADRLYIVMSMLEGLPLTELVNSMREKNEYFSEKRVWHIFIQLALALRYLHLDKKILHRDLSSNNIMIDEGDKVTITDFGLARQKHWDSSKMLSSVGTLVYSCPEIVQSLPYGEGADIWSLGCVLYQMCAHDPPFQAECILTVASRIVKGEYEPLSAVCPGRYSDLVDKVIAACLSPDPVQRPDIIGVASLITNPLMIQLDAARYSAAQAKRRLKELRDQLSLSSSMFHGDGPNFPDGIGNVRDSLTNSPSTTDLSSSQKLESRLPNLLSSTSKSDEIFGSDSPETGSSEKINTKARPSSGPVVSIAQRRLRPIDDPVLDLIRVVHKIGHLSLLPQVLEKRHQVLRRLIDSYRNRLFSATVPAVAVKNELFQLARKSSDTVNGNFLEFSVSGFDSAENGSPSGFIASVVQALPEDEQPLFSESGPVTYELLMAAVDTLLRECTNYFASNPLSG